MENSLSIDRIYISNAADATPRGQGSSVSGGGARHYVGCCDTSRFGRYGPRRFHPACDQRTTLGRPDAQESRISAKLLLAKDGLFVATSMIALSSYPSNSALTLRSQPCRILNVPKQFEDAAGSQGDSVEAFHVITSLPYGAQPLLRTSFQPTHSRSFTRLSKSDPQFTICQCARSAPRLPMCSLSHFDPSQPTATEVAFSRTLCRKAEAFVRSPSPVLSL